MEEDPEQMNREQGEGLALASGREALWDGTGAGRSLPSGFLLSLTQTLLRSPVIPLCSSRL